VFIVADAPRNVCFDCLPTKKTPRNSSRNGQLTVLNGTETGRVVRNEKLSRAAERQSVNDLSDVTWTARQSVFFFIQKKGNNIPLNEKITEKREKNKNGNKTRGLAQRTFWWWPWKKSTPCIYIIYIPVYNNTESQLCGRKLRIGYIHRSYYAREGQNNAVAMEQ